jgi:hypothetical protein
MMLLNRDSAIQSASRRFCTIYKLEKSDPLQPSGRRDIPFGRPTVQSIIRLDDENFSSEEALNCSSLHPSGHFSSTSGRHSVLDQLWDFLPKHRYGKIVATVWTHSSIRQVAHSKFRRPDVSLHGPDTRAIYMEIACIKSTIQTTIPLFWIREASIWKLLAAEVQSSRR